MGNYVDQKVTIWRRYHFDQDTDMQNVAKELAENPQFIDDIHEFEGYEDSELLYEVEGNLSLENNGMDATIEVFNNDIEIYNNEDF